ncbi:MAG: hypothetical protein ACOZAL_00270 [Patescibacteria group bacterium]
MKRNKEKIELQEFNWETPEFEKKEKTKSWFIVPAFLTIVFGIIALISDNILFLIFIILAFGVFYIYANKEPRIINFKINEKGVEIDGRLHDFDSLRSFWLFYNPPEEKEISFRSKKTFFPYLRIPLADQNPNEVRKFLLRFLPEKHHRESIIDIWMRRVGF